jgi:DNA-binding CsgD family transcriptional regulator
VMLADKIDQAEPVLAAVVADARRRGAIGTVNAALVMHAEAMLRLGRLPEAESDARESLALATEHDLPLGVPAALGCLTEVRLDREPAHTSLDLLDRYFPDGAEIPRGYARQMVLFARGRALAVAGRTTSAAEYLRSCGTSHTEWGELNPAACPWRSMLALTIAAEGASAEAARLIDEELTLASRYGADRATGIALRARALLRSGEPRIDGLREAVDVLARSPARLEHARALVDLGAAVRRTGRRVEARELLTDALDRCHACRAHVLAARCLEELHAAGARPRRERLSGVEALTASERRVAQLAADGLSNREIAQALSITTKTVETHLRRAYGKLDITHRTQLKAQLTGSRAPT